MLNGKLYRRSAEGPLLKCLSPEKAHYVLREIHEGSCSNHSGVWSLAEKVIRQGYFWPTLVKNTMEFTKKCESCQKYATLIHSPATPIEPIKIPCPFDQWRIDILGPFPLAPAQKRFIIVAVEYFSKFGIPRVLISDKGTHFQGKKIMAWYKELKIQQNFTTVENPQANR
ncbi:UNVERIFIED_CONTAM: hypothetical protein Slati_0185900 [Sesamum latifolium]|uniref:Integrase zinc-binding domain-containing protein n=1 Tax=Sesamum latifolium TaxID=2727402 RepID=A0AAW2YB52_9LAMI